MEIQQQLSETNVKRRGAREGEEEIGRQVTKLEEKTTELFALHVLASTLARSLEIGVILRESLEVLCQTLGFDAGRIFLLDRKKKLLQLKARRGISGEPAVEPSHQLEEGIIRRVAETGGMMVFEDIQADPKFGQPFGQGVALAFGYHGYACFPIQIDGQLVGVADFLNRIPRRFTPSEIGLIKSMLSQVGIGIKNALLFEEVTQKSAELERAGRIKSEFLSVMSHELRTPLNAIMGYARLLEDRTIGEINPQQGQFPARILKNSHELLGMINAILEATRIEADAIRPDHDDVAPRDLLDELRSSYDVPLDKELTLIWDYPSDLPRMHTDSAKLKQILQNLINNAIKFTERGHVRISARHLPKNETVEFKVEDTGIGIARDSLAVIFDMFRQVDSSETRLYGGMGLGLYIVKKFTELLGGTIEVESEPGKGSRFTVSLPLVAAQETERAKTTSATDRMAQQ